MVGHLHDRLARFMVLRRAGETMHVSHARIVDALRDHKADAARRAMRDELTETHAIVLERVIQEQGDYWALGRRPGLSGRTGRAQDDGE